MLGLSSVRKIMLDEPDRLSSSVCIGFSTCESSNETNLDERDDMLGLSSVSKIMLDETDSFLSSICIGLITCESSNETNLDEIAFWVI